MQRSPRTGPRGRVSTLIRPVRNRQIRAVQGQIIADGSHRDASSYTLDPAGETVGVGGRSEREIGDPPVFWNVGPALPPLVNRYGSTRAKTIRSVAEHPFPSRASPAGGRTGGRPAQPHRAHGSGRRKIGTASARCSRAGNGRWASLGISSPKRTLRTQWRHGFSELLQAKCPADSHRYSCHRPAACGPCRWAAERRLGRA